MIHIKSERQEFRAKNSKKHADAIRRRKESQKDENYQSM
jgi:hypothetical protein